METSGEVTKVVPNTSEGILTVTVTEVQPFTFQPSCQTQIQSQDRPNLRRKQAHQSLRLHIPHPIPLDSPASLPTTPRHGAKKESSFDTSPIPPNQTSRLALRRRQGTLELRPPKSESSQDTSSMTGSPAGSSACSSSVVFGISMSECDEYDPVIEEATLVTFRRVRAVEMTVGCSRLDSNQQTQSSTKPAPEKDSSEPPEANTPPSEGGNRTRSSSQLAEGSEAEHSTQASQVNSECTLRFSSSDRQLETTTKPREILPFYPSKSHIVLTEFSVQDKIADQHNNCFEIKGVQPADHLQSNQGNGTSNKLPSQIGPFTFERVAPVTGQSSSRNRHSAPSHLSSPALVLSNRRPISMWPLKNSNDTRKGGAAIVDEQPRQKLERVETWITDLDPESCVDPETCLPMPTPRPANNTPSRQDQPEPEQGKLAPPRFPFLDTPPPMDSKYSKLTAARLGQGRNHPHPFEVTDRKAIQGNFIPISKSLNKRSPSPKREPESREIYYQLSLTESQINRLTSVLTQEDDDVAPPRGRRHPEHTPSKQVSRENHVSPSPARAKSPVKANTPADTPAPRRSRSPVKFWSSNKNQDSQPKPPADTPSRQRSRSPMKFWGNSKSLNTRHAAYDFDEDETLLSTNKQSGHPKLTSSATSPMASPPPALRRPDQGTHGAVATEASQRRAPASPTPLRRRSKGPVVTQYQEEMSPLTPDFSPNPHYTPSEFSSSVYSQDIEVGFVPPQPNRISVSPLRIKKEEVPNHISVLQGYTEWMNSPCVPDPESDGSHLARLQQARGSELAATNTTEMSAGEPQFSALTPFTPTFNLPGQHRVMSKTMIGHNGWLESTSKPVETRTPPTRKATFLDNLVKRAKEMVQTGNDPKAKRRSRDSEKSQSGNPRALAVSLNPREQSLLYCELEYVLTTAINDYITAEFNAGRLDHDKMKKVSEMWQQRGRPKVMSFRYDLETQLEIVKLHVNEFKFYGTTVNPTAILGVIDMMKVDARVLRIRTFCQPDTVIAKQLLDSQNLFNILGCPEFQQIQLAEITNFFKAVMERQRLYAERGEPAPVKKDSLQLQRSNTQHKSSSTQHKSSSTQHKSSNTQHKSNSTQHKSNSTQHRSTGTGTQPHQSYGTHVTHGTQYHSHGAQHQGYETNPHVRRQESHVALQMDPASHASDDGY